MKYPQEIIDWLLLAEANSFYANNGFQQIETPFAIPSYYHSFTKPHDNQTFVLNNGLFSNNSHELVGSAEQGFIYLLLNDLLPGNKLQSITPCFRFDDYDKLHQPWFMKLELFQLSDNSEDLFNVISIATNFFERHSSSKVNLINTDNNMYDLEINNIEVGSYGFRTVNEYTFIYATGLALPRFTIVNKL